MEDGLSDPDLLKALLQLDQSLRIASAQPPIADELPDSSREQLQLAAAALRRLETELPRNAAPRPAWIPDHIGRFEILSVLGMGGFSIVYLAFDPVNNQRLAIKIPRPACLMDPGLRKRFITEARTTALLDHPNIAPVFEAGEAEELPWLAAALCEGPDLETWLRGRREPVPVRIAAELCRRLALAVHYSHQQGVLHRDIKPDNILLFPDPQSDIPDFPWQPRLADFGLARLQEVGRVDSATSQLLGTPRYMPPEVIRASTAAATEQSDVYALGAVLYCLLTGTPPFNSASTAETLRRILETEPASPTSRDASIPPAISWICLKCLEKIPRLRYSSAADLATDLDRFLTGRQVQARGRSMGSRLLRWSQRQPFAAALAGLTTLIILGAVTAWISWTQSLSRMQTRLLQERYRSAELIFAADLYQADDAWHAGDPAAAAGILSRYHTLPPDLAAAGAAAAEFATQLMQRRISRTPLLTATTSQTLWDTKLSPDGQQLAVCGAQGRLQILDANSLKLSSELPLSDVELNEIAWSHDGHLLATGDDSGRVFIIDVRRQSILHTLQSFQPNAVFGLLFIPGTQKLLVCGRNSHMLILESDTDAVIYTIATPHTTQIESVVLSPNKQFLVTAGGDGRVCRWGLPDFSLDWQFQLPDDDAYPISAIAIDPDSGYLVISGRAGELWRLDADSGHAFLAWQGLDRIHALTFAPWGLLAGDAGGVISEFTTPMAANEVVRPVSQWLAHNQKISALEPVRLISHETTVAVVSADRDGLLHVWGNDQGRGLPVPLAGSPDCTGAANAVAWAHDERLLQCSIRGLLQHNLTGSGGSEVIAFTDQHLTACAAVPTAGGLLAAGTADGRLLIKDSGKETAIDVFQGEPVISISLDQSGKVAAVHCGTDEVAVYRLRDFRELLRLQSCAAQIISPDGASLITAKHSSNHIEKHDLTNLTLPAVKLAVHRNTVSDLALSKDGELLVSASHDRSIAITKLAGQMLSQKISGPPAVDLRIALHPAGRLAARTFSKTQVVLMDLAARRDVLMLDQRFTNIQCLEFSPGGERLAVVDRDGTITVIQPESPQIKP